MERLQCLLDELATLVSKEKTGELIIAACGVEVPIYEYCYRSGLEDGIRLSNMLKRLKKP